MILFWVAFSALLASLLTFFSGFGLGTLLMPVFALSFSVQVAVAATALVHLFNNLVKLLLTVRHADWPVVFRFGLPAMLAALPGALVVTRVPDIVLKPVVGILIILFALFELLPRFGALAFDTRWLVWGGIASGFFGGLSGHQGALRSAFLIRAELDKEQFIATGVVISVAVDIVRLAVYGWQMDGFSWLIPDKTGIPVAVGCMAAALGAVAGQRLLHKTTLPLLQGLVGILLLLLGLALTLNWV